MKAHELNSQNPFVRGYYINPEVCDKIINESSTKEFLPGREFVGYTATFLSFYDQSTIDLYFSELFKAVNEYKTEFYWCYENLKIWNLDQYVGIQHYTPGKHYRIWHPENDGSSFNIKRHLVFMTYLNDIEDEGGTEFYYQKLKVKPEKGLTLIWPADWTHTHRGVVSETEEKYIATGWFVFG